MDMCGRCGIFHSWRSSCGAINAKCRRCFAYGHFARVCRTSTFRRTTSLQQEFKQRRDTERMTAFLRRKDSANMPFHSLSIGELRELSFNSIGSCGVESSELLTEIESLETHVMVLEDLNKHYQSQIQTLEQSIVENEHRYLKPSSPTKSTTETATQTPDQTKPFSPTKSTTEAASQTSDQTFSTTSMQASDDITTELQACVQALTIDKFMISGAFQNLQIELERTKLERDELQTTMQTTMTTMQTTTQIKFNELTQRLAMSKSNYDELMRARSEIEFLQRELSQFNNAYKGDTSQNQSSIQNSYSRGRRNRRGR